MLSHALMMLWLATQAPQAPKTTEAPDTTTELTAPELARPEGLHDRAMLLSRQHAFVDLVPLFGEATSRGGRALYALRLAGPDEADAGTRPAILVVANPDGPDAFACAMALDHAQTLAERYAAGDGDARALLDSTTLYVVPSANPDGAAARFEQPLLERLATGAGVDNDRDGRGGEDGPGDLDGDGRILSMLVAEDGGTWIADPDHGSIVRPAKPEAGEVGQFTLWPEGLDDDGDEAVAEDAAHDARVNANFAHGWREHSPEAGRYPNDEPAARALAEFVMAHPDIALVLTYGMLDNLVESPKGAKPSGRIPPDAVLEDDAGVLAELGKRYRELVEHEAKARGERGGSFQEWVYHHRGLPSLAVVPWDIPLKPEPVPEPEATDDEGEDETAQEETGPEEPETKPQPEPAKEKPSGKASDEVKRLRWVESRGEEDAWRHQVWTPFDHPQLGAVTIGGWAPYARLDPPADHAAQVSTDQLAFLVSLGELLPRLELQQPKARALGGGLAEVTVAVANPALLPVRSAKAIDTRTVNAPRVELALPDDAELLGGRRIELIRDGDLAAGGRAELRWLVGGLPAGGTIDLALVSDHAGSRTVTLTVSASEDR